MGLLGQACFSHTDRIGLGIDAPLIHTDRHDTHPCRPWACVVAPPLTHMRRHMPWCRQVTNSISFLFSLTGTSFVIRRLGLYK